MSLTAAEFKKKWSRYQGGECRMKKGLALFWQADGEFGALLVLFVGGDAYAGVAKNCHGCLSGASLLFSGADRRLVLRTMRCRWHSHGRVTRDRR